MAKPNKIMPDGSYKKIEKKMTSDEEYAMYQIKAMAKAKADSTKNSKSIAEAISSSPSSTITKKGKK